MNNEEKQDAQHWDAVEEATELMQEGRFIEALIELRRVIKEDRTNPYGYHFLGAALFETNEYAAARDAYWAALTLAPGYMGSRVGLSNTLRLLGDVDGALKQAQIVLRKLPNDADALHAAGLAEAARGDHERARKHLHQFLTTKPEYEAQIEVSKILESLGVNDNGDFADPN